jgi:hypothetical protein
MSVAVRDRKELRDIDPSLPVLKIDTVEEQMNDLLAQERLVAELSAFFGRKRLVNLSITHNFGPADETP